MCERFPQDHMNFEHRGPMVSVVVPTYNCAQLLVQALRSVVRQSFENWEAIVVDNSSEDDTITVVASLQDPRVRLVSIRNDGIIAASRNLGIREARGQYVAFLDADDLWLPHKLSDQVAALTAHPELSFVYSIARLFGDTSWLTNACGIMPRLTNAALDRDSLIHANVICGSSVLASREVLLDVGGFAENRDLRMVEDYDLWLKLAATGKVGFIPRIHVLYRVHAGGLSRDSKAMLERIRQLFALRGLPLEAQKFPVGRSWLFKAGRYLAMEGMASVLYGLEWIGRNTTSTVPVLFRQ
jgi:glycosyltransferase involved in cell wall biosynthesis